jgi:hypothetical protein
MYASDISNRNRAATLYQNLLIKQAEFNSGNSIRVDRQRGGIDYSYISQLLEGSIEDLTWKLEVPVNLKQGNSTLSTSTYGMTLIDISSITDLGAGVTGTLDDAVIPISTASTDFYFFETNCGIANTIKWNTNNALLFNSSGNNTTADISATFGPAILLGQYDRRLNSIYTSNFTTNGFYVTKFIVNFDDYYTGSTGTGSFMIRLIREQSGNNRQWVEVTVIQAPPSPGYSTQVSNYPSGYDASGNPINSDGNRIDPTKLSPYNITNGSAFLNPCGTLFGTSSPTAGTSFVFQSDKLGKLWNFYNNTFLNIE